MSSENLEDQPSWLLLVKQAEPAEGGIATVHLPIGLKTTFSEVRLDRGPKSLKGGWNSRCETREFARTTILRPCVKRLGMSSYLLALNGWGLYAYGRLGNMRL